MNGVWQKAGDRIRDTLGQTGYETWIGPLTFVGLQDKTATIEAPNRFFRDWVNDRYLDLIRQTISARGGRTDGDKIKVGSGFQWQRPRERPCKNVRQWAAATPAPL